MFAELSVGLGEHSLEAAATGAILVEVLGVCERVRAS